MDMKDRIKYLLEMEDGWEENDLPSEKTIGSFLEFYSKIDSNKYPKPSVFFNACNKIQLRYTHNNKDLTLWYGKDISLYFKYTHNNEHIYSVLYNVNPVMFQGFLDWLIT